MHVTHVAGAPGSLLGGVASCGGAVGAPLAALAQEHCHLGAQLQQAQAAMQGARAQAELQQRLAVLDEHMRAGVLPPCPS